MMEYRANTAAPTAADATGPATDMTSSSVATKGKRTWNSDGMPMLSPSRPFSRANKSSATAAIAAASTPSMLTAAAMPGAAVSDIMRVMATANAMAQAHRSGTRTPSSRLRKDENAPAPCRRRRAPHEASAQDARTSRKAYASESADKATAAKNAASRPSTASPNVASESAELMTTETSADSAARGAPMRENTRHHRQNDAAMPAASSIAPAQTQRSTPPVHAASGYPAAIAAAAAAAIETAARNDAGFADRKAVKPAAAQTRASAAHKGTDHDPISSISSREICDVRGSPPHSVI